MAFSRSAIDRIRTRVPRTSKIGENTYALTTTARTALLVPEGVVIYDTDLGMYFHGDGVTYGGTTQSEPKVRVVTCAAASAFTNPSTYVTSSAQTGASESFTATGHGLTVGDQVTLMSASGTPADVGLVVDTTYTVATVANANTFTLTGVAFESNGTQTLVFRVYDASVNNYVTWEPGGATLRTGDGITAAQVGTLPSGISNSTEYYIVKDVGDDTGTSFRLSDTHAHALAGTDIIVVRSEGAGANTFVATDVWAQVGDDVIVCDSAVAVDIYLPSAVTYDYKKFSVSHGSGTAAGAVVVKSDAGKVAGAAAGTGKTLKASTVDFINVVSDGTDWITTGLQITP